MVEDIFLRSLLISFPAGAEKLEEVDGVGFTGKVDIVLAT
jgi:hypothetical protein